MGFLMSSVRCCVRSAVRVASALVALCALVGPAVATQPAPRATVATAGPAANRQATGKRGVPSSNGQSANAGAGNAGAGSGQAGNPLTPADDLFLAAREAARTGDRDRLAQLAAPLAGHPLAAWVDYWRLQLRIKAGDAELAEVQAFQDGHPDTYLADRLRADWLVALALRGDLARFEQERRLLVWNHDEPQLRCALALMRYLRNEGRRIDALASDARRVLATSRDGAGGDGCMALGSALVDDNRLVATERLRLLIEQNQLAAARKLAAPDWLAAIDQPAAWLRSQSTPPRALPLVPRALAIAAISRLAREEPEEAARYAMLIDLELNAAQRGALWGRIGHMGAVKLLPQAVEWYRRGGEQVGVADTVARADEVLDWQVRAALRGGPGSLAPDWPMIRATIERMPEEQRREPAWIYWHARAVLALTGGAPGPAELARRPPRSTARAVIAPIPPAAAPAPLQPVAAATPVSPAAAANASADPIGSLAAALDDDDEDGRAEPSAATPGGADGAARATPAPAPRPAPSPVTAQSQARRDAIEALRGIAGRMHFYGQLAAEELGETFVLPPAPPAPAAAEVAALSGSAGFARARKLLELGLRPEGAREWGWELRRANDNHGMNDRQLLAAAEYARRLGLLDRMISTSERTQLEIDVLQRYPAPNRDLLLRHAQAQGLDPDFVLGLIRQESRFVAEARSSSGALGLMQLMPATARFVARRIGQPELSTARLTDIDTNLRLGTTYLKMVLVDLDGLPALAAAAYNAGPNRPRAWRASLQRPVEGAIFTETIPFNETRDYVKRVLANTVHYAALADGRAPSLKAWLGTIAPKAAGASDIP
jgi:soluble lytic murein transglycosylase-like protein